jgi:hypothetical protein
MVFVKTFKLILVLSFVALAAIIVMAQDDDTQAKMENAMSAAPPSVSAEATILDVSPEGEIIQLQEGTNGWTCFPDNPVSPGNDPICIDPNIKKCNDYKAAGVDPELTSPGFAYMLQGGSDASNTDPRLLEPPEGEDWISTPPHVMIVFPDPLDPALYSSDHASGLPYVMWAGTMYEHVMMPVTDHDHESE